MRRSAVLRAWRVRQGLDDVRRVRAPLPGSGYADSARFWLGNALYGKRDYKEAITAFRTMANSAPDHPRAPEALLAIANCQVEDHATARPRARPSAS